MFDATKFGVAVVVQDTFEAISSDNKTFCYAWKYQQSPADETEENARAEDFLKFLSGEVQLEGFIPRYANQAIVFAGNDMGSDRGMMIMLLLYDYRNYGICFLSGYQRHDCKRSGGHWYTAGVWLYQTGTHDTLYDHASDRHASQCAARQYSWLFVHEELLRGYVLWKLQFADLCDDLEWRSIRADNGYSCAYDDGSDLDDFAPKVETVAAAVSAQRFAAQTSEKAALAAG